MWLFQRPVLQHLQWKEAEFRSSCGLSARRACAQGTWNDRYPDDTLVLRQSGSSRPDDEVESLEPFGMTVQKSCEYRWRSFRNHLKYRRIVFKVTKISPVLQIYLINNQIFNYKFWCRFEPLIKVFDDGVLYRYKSSSVDSKLYQVIFFYVQQKKTMDISKKTITLQNE